ncbi:MAG: tRNA (adenosine(37)-N6)-threonylcarbamoyltransferase complex transferase subunit TsaD [bacterium]
MKILAIDTSCDETSVAVCENNKVISNVVSSQVELHKKWGGVVPDISRRAHKENIDKAIKEALKRAKTDISKIDCFAATYGPGLAIALEVGLKKAQELAIENNKPFVPVNHMEGHLLSSFALNQKKTNTIPRKNDLPAIGLLVSGGHTELILMKDFGKYKKIGETLDDAAGEAFDKVAKMLDLGYPGGPIISEFAKKGMTGSFDLPIPMERSGNLNFSYSGLKTACLYLLEKTKKTRKKQSEWVYDFCSDFVRTVTKSLVIKLEHAVDKYHPKSVLLGGGVLSNVEIRRGIRKSMNKYGIKVFQPYSERMFTDNGAMIGVAAFFNVKNGSKAVLKGKRISKIDRDPVLSL